MQHTQRALGFDPGQLSKFLRQIQLLFPMLEDPHSPPIPPLLHATRLETYTFNYLSHVYANVDNKLPFRDMAVSRRTVLAPDGPFSPSNLRTRAGFFSVLVHRAITHNSEMLKTHHHIMFNDIAEFHAILQSYAAEIALDPIFACDPTAYGARTKLSPEHATTYWKSSGNPSYNWWIESEEPIEFLDLHALFDSQDFPNIGGLIGFLIAADYAIAGLATTPNAATMGRMVFNIRRGALTGLRLLGFGCDTEELTSAAFVMVHDELEKWLTEDQKKRMNFSVFVVEHMLCKFRRLSGSVYDMLAEVL